MRVDFPADYPSASENFPEGSLLYFRAKHDDELVVCQINVFRGVASNI